MKIIGITGPTGAGKTTALRALEALGGRTVDCDAVYHDLLVHDRVLLQELRERFGDDVFSPDGSLDRKALGKVVFGDADALSDLNAITHKYVRSAVSEFVEQAQRDGVCAVAVDAIALLESGIADLCCCTVAVTAQDEVRVKRIMEREGISEEYARLRVNAQKKEEWFRANCTHVLLNDCADADAFQSRARELFDRILTQQEDM